MLHYVNRQHLVGHLAPKFFFTLLFLAAATPLLAQENSQKGPASIVITGARFCYPLVQRWIEEYTLAHPDAHVIIEPRGSSDPSSYDILIESFPPADDTRDYAYVGRYPIMIVANRKSQLARDFGDRPITRELITQLFFHDLTRGDGSAPSYACTVYTRLQRAGVPMVFTHYFGYAQKDIRGTAVAGSDAHLLNAVLRDSTGLSYLPLCLSFNHASGKPVEGLQILPVDINDDGKISEEEKFHQTFQEVVAALEMREPHHIPIGIIHLSVEKKDPRPAAVSFIKWVVEHGSKDLPEFGYLKPDTDKSNSDRFSATHNN